jgi:FMN phosphatase YigB (HAD superfamily)
MSVPSVVAFDLGRVLLDFDYGIVAARIARRGQASVEQVRQLLDHSPLLRRLESGRMTSEQFAVEVCATCGFSGTVDEFYAAFGDIFVEIPPMTALQAALRSRGFPTYIFSNTNGIAIGHIRRRFPFFANFDGYVLSYEQGACKPEPEIYAALERMAGKEGGAILYLDDRAENVQAGLARGWRALLHETPEKTIPLVRGLGLPV